MKYYKMSVVVLAVFLFSLLFPVSFAVPVQAQTTGSDAISKIVDEMQEIYVYFDDADKSAVASARSNLQGLSDNQLNEVIAPLITNQVIEAFGSETEAETALREFIKDLSVIYYSSDTDGLENTLINFKHEHRTTFQTLFGSEITVEELYNLMAAARDELGQVINASDANVLTQGTTEQVISKAQDLAKRVLDEVITSEFEGKLGTIGWNTDRLVDCQNDLAALIDADGAAQMAVAKAAVRSRAVLYNYNTVTETETELGTRDVSIIMNSDSSKAFTLQIADRPASALAGWTSSNTAVAIVNTSMGYPVVCPQGAGTATIWAYREGGGKDEWILKFTVTVSQKVTAGEGVSTPVTTEQPVDIIVPETVEEYSIKTAPTPSGSVKEATLPQVVLNKLTADGTINMSIPQGTKVTGASDWDGTIKAPQVVTSPAAAIDGDVEVVLELGAPTGSLTFDKPVLLVLPGQYDKTVAYIIGGETVAHKVPNNNNLSGLDSTDKYAEAASALGSNQDGSVNHGNKTDKVVWTKHFTQFVAYTPKTTPGGGGSSGGGGGGALSPSVTANIKATGGRVSSYGLTLEIPDGALDKEIEVTLEKITSTSRLPLPEGAELVSDVVEVSKDESGDFKEDVAVTVEFDADKLDLNKYNLVLCWLDENEDKWQELNNTQVDTKQETVKGYINHLGKFAVLAVPKEEIAEPPAPPAPPVVELTDISGHWAATNIRNLVTLGAISGYPDKTFKPDNNITRAEFTTVLVKAMNIELVTGQVFDDTVNHWAKAYIATAAARGIVSGYSESEFGADDPITREQMAAMVVRAAGLQPAGPGKVFADSEAVSSWAEPAVDIASSKNIISGYPDNTFKPQGKATRAEAVTVILKALP